MEQGTHQRGTPGAAVEGTGLAEGVRRLRRRHRGYILMAWERSRPGGTPGRVETGWRGREELAADLKKR